MGPVVDWKQRIHHWPLVTEIADLQHCFEILRIQAQSRNQYIARTIDETCGHRKQARHL
jgi:hypothetical protein